MIFGNLVWLWWDLNPHAPRRTAVLKTAVYTSSTTEPLCKGELSITPEGFLCGSPVTKRNRGSRLYYWKLHGEGQEPDSQSDSGLPVGLAYSDFHHYSKYTDFSVQSDCFHKWSIVSMRPLPAPHVPGKTEFERFDNAVRQVLTVSKDDLLKKEAREKRAQEKRNKKKPAISGG